MSRQLYIGLMSGTSADSLDAALVDFSTLPLKVVNTYSLPIAKKTRNLIHQLAIAGNNEIAHLRQLDRETALLSCKVVRTLCQQANCQLQSIIAIGSHGQTIRHYPTKNHETGYSLQVGDPNIIAENLGVTTISDFRRRDIAAGGQGAPLAPAFHNAVFHSKNKDRIILNLGGIANITLLTKSGKVIGYDTGPANGLMDSWCQKHQGKPYDIDGKWASEGNTNNKLLEQLLAHPFFTQSFPKSTGREEYNLPWLEQEIASFKHTLKPEDIQATLLQLTVESIANAIEQHDQQASADLYLCGGGTHNPALFNALITRLKPRRLASTEALGISPDWVEAIAFAWLAKQTMDKAAGNLPAVTGANRDVILGGIYLG
ncbi:anhydro-N-acetylmuramic acid kinase [Candidatus Endobugula sertula]|uniref:Anhydro-N-acetylmuramic acid kinase n=1 Tax=Candidatus Endobugula sertula TaxID=62101 RepID=A0A1D2QT62_9GAMM|nr:anhydro-N-acetylmuramic acid kinase [Candidatus Endobugula sertula]